MAVKRCALGLIALILFAGLLQLSGCSLVEYLAGTDSSADLVFVNGSTAAIGSVTVNGEGESHGARNADGSPLRRWDSLSFQVLYTYPVTVTVCSDLNGEEPMLSLTVGQTPPEGERWYVVARGEAGGLTLELSIEPPAR